MVYNEIELALEDVKGKDTIYLSKEAYKNIRKDKKRIEEAYNIKIKKARGGK